MEKPIVSVIIPCYNQGQYLKEAVDSVLASTYENLEIIVVNDGSTKDIELLNTFFAPKTRVFHQENQGLASARNNAIAVAKGKYILPLDADDKIYPAYIERAVNVLEGNGKIGIVYCKAEFFGNKKGEWEIAEYRFPDILWTNSIFCSAMFKKSDWEKVGGYKKEMFGFEDWEFWLSLIEEGCLVYRIPEVLFSYRQTDDAMSERLSKSNEKVVLIKKIISLHTSLYLDNLEKVLLPLSKTIEFYASRKNSFTRFRYKINNVLREILTKTSLMN